MTEAAAPGEAAGVRRGIGYFDVVAPRYDLMRRLVSGGREARWKRESLERAVPASARAALDLATGTGDVAAVVRDVAPGIRIVGLDGNRAMIRRARSKFGAAPFAWVLADLHRVPLAPASVDVITAAYALRYCVDLPRFFARCHELLRPGGVFWAFDLGRPSHVALHAIWVAYLALTGVLLGTFLHGRPGTYWHLVSTLASYPGQRRVAAQLAGAGFRDVECRELIGGVLAIHVARK